MYGDDDNLDNAIRYPVLMAWKNGLDGVWVTYIPRNKHVNYTLLDFCTYRTHLPCFTSSPNIHMFTPTPRLPSRHLRARQPKLLPQSLRIPPNVPLHLALPRLIRLHAIKTVMRQPVRVLLLDLLSHIVAADGIALANGTVEVCAAFATA